MADTWPALFDRLADRYDEVIPFFTGFAVHLPVADPQTCWDFHMSHGLAATVEALSPTDAAELRRHALTELARMHADGGIVVDRGATAYLATAPTG